MKIQSVITACVDSGVVRVCYRCTKARVPGWHTRGSVSSTMRTWTTHGPTLEPEEYADSVRLRLGCAGSTEPVACDAHVGSARPVLSRSSSRTCLPAPQPRHAPHCRGTGSLLINDGRAATALAVECCLRHLLAALASPALGLKLPSL